MNDLLLNINSKVLGGMGSVFHDRYVRQAVEMGIDRERSIRSFDHGLSVATIAPPSKPRTAFKQRPCPYSPPPGKELKVSSRLGSCKWGFSRKRAEIDLPIC